MPKAIIFKKLTLNNLLQNIHDQKEALFIWMITAFVFAAITILGFLVLESISD